MNLQKTAKKVRTGCGLTALLAMALAVPTGVSAAEIAVDAVEIAEDTNIVVAANDVLKIEYVYGDNPVTVTKSGGGRLEIATSSISNLSVVVAEGTFASARPAALQHSDDFRPALRIDANDTSKFTISKSNGTNFISKITDADGGPRWLTNWGGTYNKPYVAEEKLNGMELIDFGLYLDRNVAALSGGHGGNLAVNKVDGQDGFILKEYFYVWKDRDDAYDPRLANEADFYGPSVLGNNGNAYLRCKGNVNQGFGLLTTGSWDTFKKNIVLDGQKRANTYCPSRGFHVLRNRAYDDRDIYLTMIAWNYPRGGGIYLAELIACTNVLSEATARRVEAQLQSKWMGMKVEKLKVNEGATLDVGAFPFKIGTLDVQDNTTIAGMTNLCCNAIARASSNVVVMAAVTLDGERQPLVPDLAFTGDAEISVSGTSRIQTVSSTTDQLVKSGDGELRLVDPAVSNITVEAGTLSVSPLYVRSAEYHLDATRIDTLDYAETDGTNLVSAWHDIEDPVRIFRYPSWRRMRCDDSRALNKPYLAESAVRGLRMVDFGTFRSSAYPNGWGGCLDGSPGISVSRDTFVVWIDDPDVKNYPLVNGAEFSGPCFLGMQYHWTRGKGGNGNSFAVHGTGCPINMWNPPESGRVIVDGAVVHGQNYRVGDGVHVLAQRTDMNDGSPGAPIEEIGCSYQPDIYGGLKIGEALMFREFLTDRLRMRISGALCSRWRGDTNEWAYGAVSVAAGATLNHPYADLVPESLALEGTVSAVSVKPKALRVAGAAAAVDGVLLLGEGGRLEIGGDYESGLACVSATSVNVSGRGTLVFTGEVSPRFIKSERRVVASSDVTMEEGAYWTAPSLATRGMRAVLRAKADGLYVEFSSNGMTMSFR